MNDLTQQLGRDWPLIAAALMLFFATFAITFMMMRRASAERELRRRASGIRETSFGEEINPRSPRAKSQVAVQKFINQISQHFSSVDPEKAKVLRSQLIQGGLYDPRWVPAFFVLRLTLGVSAFLFCYIVLPSLMNFSDANEHLMLTCATTLVSYMGPVFWLNSRIKKRAQEHLAGFPDFMDLLVVCADAGVSMEAALGRVGRELAESYPSLSANLHLTVLEIRAGKTVGSALEQLGERLSIEEARTFATLLQQSEELGSSLTEALRVYSDEMRHKRLSRAEEKAYALPAKLVIPLGIFIFPVLFVVILLPAAMKVSNMQ